MLTSFLLRFWKPLAGIVLLALCWLWFQHALSQADAAGYQRRATEDLAAADQQAARNRELQRAAELRYVVQTGVREKWFVTTVKEISDAAAPLAACPVPDAVRVRLNEAARCARGDSATPDCPAGEVPIP